MYIDLQAHVCMEMYRVYQARLWNAKTNIKTMFMSDLIKLLFYVSHVKRCIQMVHRPCDSQNNDTNCVFISHFLCNSALNS